MRNDPKPAPVSITRGPSASVVAEEELNPHEAAFRNQVEALRKAIEKAKIPDIKDSENATPLHHAAIAGALDCLKLLLSKSADVASVDNERTFTSPPLFTFSKKTNLLKNTQ